MKSLSACETTTILILGVQTLKMLGAVAIAELGQLLWKYVFGGMSVGCSELGLGY